MDSQEITEELGHPGARNLLDSATLLRLAYNGSDGFPRVIPIGFYWNRKPDRRLYGGDRAQGEGSVVASERRDDDRRRRDAWGCKGAPCAWARTRGHRGRRSQRVPRGIEEVPGPDQATDFEGQVRSIYDQMARIFIEPVWARFFDFSVGRLPSFLTKLVGDA